MSQPRDNLVPFDHSPEYWMRRAGKRKNNAEHALAAFLYRRAYEQTRQSGIALQMAENFYQMGCFSAARRIAVDLLRDDPSNAKAYYWLGMTALAAMDEELGEQALALALKKTADFALADEIQDLLSDYPWSEPSTFRRSQRAWSHYERALAEVQAGDLMKAEMRLRLALRRGICPEADALLGEVLFYRKQYTEAIRFLRRALLYIHEQPSIWLLLAQSYAALSRRQEASFAFSRALPLIRTSREWGIAASAAFFMKETDTIRAALKEELRKSPDSNDLLYVLSAVEANSGHLHEALRYLNAILDRDPDDRDGKTALCILGYGPIPFCRIPDDDALINELVYSSRPEGDGALRRLIHGLTISMGGAASYKDVSGLVGRLWESLSPLQRRLCDRQSLWPNAFYQTLCLRLGIDDLPAEPALWPMTHYPRRIRRMRRYLTGLLSDKKGDHHA